VDYRFNTYPNLHRQPFSLKNNHLNLKLLTSAKTASMGSLPDYSLPAEQVSFSGFLFDMDGTIIDSTPAIVKHWHTYVTITSLLFSTCAKHILNLFVSTG
jgi:hypothetical protein